MPKTVTALVIFSFLFTSQVWAGTYVPSCLNDVRNMALNELASGIVPIGSDQASGAIYNFTRVGSLDRNRALNTKYQLFKATSQRDRRHPEAVYAEMYLFVEQDTCILLDVSLIH